MLIDSAREKYFTGKYVKRWWRKKQKSLVTRNRPTWPDSPSFLTSEKAIHLMYHCWDKEMVSSQTWAGSALLPVSLGSHPASGWVPCQYWQGGGLALLAQQDLTYKGGLAWVSPKSAGMLPRWQLCFYLGHSCRYAGMRTRLGAWVWDGKGVAGKGMGFSCSWPDVRVAKLSSEVQPAAGPQPLLLEVLAMPWNPLLSVRHPNNLPLVPCIEGDTYLLKALSETSKLKKREEVKAVSMFHLQLCMCISACDKSKSVFWCRWTVPVFPSAASTAQWTVTSRAGRRCQQSSPVSAWILLHVIATDIGDWQSSEDEVTEEIAHKAQWYHSV